MFIYTVTTSAKKPVTPIKSSVNPVGKCKSKYGMVSVILVVISLLTYLHVTYSTTNTWRIYNIVAVMTLHIANVSFTIKNVVPSIV